MDQVLTWVEQHLVLAFIISVVVLIILTLIFKSNTVKIFSSKRSVSAGRDINAPITTGDKNTNKMGGLGTLASLATILSCLIALYLLIKN
jgi:hypothetical protein